MYDFLTLARERRSVRAFRPDPVPPELLDRVLEAARWAPSAGNRQAWRVAVLTTRAERERLRRRPDDFLVAAPVVLAFCADTRAAAAGYGERGASLYAVQDATLACAHAMLAAADAGLGSCWVGAFDEQQVAAALRLPDALRPVALLPMGRPAETPAAPARRPTAEARL